MTYKDLAFDALKELGIYQAGDTPSAEDLADALSMLTRVVDNCNADDRAVYAEAFPEYTLVPSLQPHTIGPTLATWTATQRPERIDGANLILPATPNNTNIPIRVNDYQWWLNQPVPGLTTNYPTDLYYQPDWPNGKIFFWPVPTTAYDVQLALRLVLDSAFNANTTFTLPPGYRDYYTTTTAMALLSSFGAAARPAPNLPQRQRMAEQRVFGANVVVPRIATAQSGVPTGDESSIRTSFNYYSRTWNP